MKMDCEALFWGTLLILFPLCCWLFVFFVFASYSDAGKLHVHENYLEQCHYFYL